MFTNDKTVTNKLRQVGKVSDRSSYTFDYSEIDNSFFIILMKNTIEINTF